MYHRLSELLWVMSIDCRLSLKKDVLANGWEWGGIKEFVTKKILPVKGGRHQDVSISKKQPPCYDFISIARVSKWAISFQMEMFLTYIFSTISYQCNLLPLDLAGKTIDWRRRPFYTISYVSTRKTTQKWFSEMSFSF